LRFSLTGADGTANWLSDGALRIEGVDAEDVHDVGQQPAPLL